MAPKVFEGSRWMVGNPMAQEAVGIHSLGFQNPNDPIYIEREAAVVGV